MPDISPTSEPESARRRIALVDEKPFALGPLRVEPALRQLIGRDGTIEVLEPRVMQVLVALARADGAVVSRDMLTNMCWEGRVVGEDAITRVLSRLRRTSEGVAKGVYLVETVSKVGYRLRRLDGQSAERQPVRSTAEQPSRRGLLLGLGATGLAAAGGLVWWTLGSAERALPSATRALYDQGFVQLRQDTQDGFTQAIGLFRQVTEQAPSDPRGWAALGLAYAQAIRTRPPALQDQLEARAKEAANRALALDRGDPVAAAALIEVLPRRGAWAEIERRHRDALAAHPRSSPLLLGLAGTLADVGRVGEASDRIGEALKIDPPTPALLAKAIRLNGAARRFEQADRLADQAIATYPSNVGVWFARLYHLLFSDRTEEALAFARAMDRRPPGVPQEDFDLVESVMAARLAGTDAAISAAIARQVDAARRGSGYAQNAMMFASHLDRGDAALALARAFYFDEGFVVPALQFSGVQSLFMTRPNRRTAPLFGLGSATLRAAPGFDALTQRLGLADYWARTGTKPDPGAAS